MNRRDYSGLPDPAATHNEENRLSFDDYRGFLLQNPSIGIIFVDWVGRVFVTVLDVFLNMPFYVDTQCGAKLFRANEALRKSLARPFNPMDI